MTFKDSPEGQTHYFGDSCIPPHIENIGRFKKGHRINNGKKYSLKRRNKISASLTGKIRPISVKKKISETLTDKFSNEKSWNWKGDKVGYSALHRWVTKFLGKPTLCEKCRTTKKGVYDWANISGEYKRELTDWVRLCRKCHMESDGRNNYLRICNKK